MVITKAEWTELEARYRAWKQRGGFRAQRPYDLPDEAIQSEVDAISSMLQDFDQTDITIKLYTFLRGLPSSTE